MLGQFFKWLELQQERPDVVGHYARLAVKNIQYPRTSRLTVLLRYEPDETRQALKRAHREWRRAHKLATTS